MSNKELAVQLYSAILQASSSVAASPNFQGTVRVPTYDEAVEHVAELAGKLARIKDN